MHQVATGLTGSGCEAALPSGWVGRVWGGCRAQATELAHCCNTAYPKLPRPTRWGPVTGVVE